MNVLEKHKIDPQTLGVLQFIAINGKEDQYVRSYINTYLYDGPYLNDVQLHKIWEAKGWITYVKKIKKTDTPADLVRLGEQGRIIVKTYGDVGEHPLTKFTFDTLKELYQKNKFESAKVKGGKDVNYSISEFLHFKSHYTEKMIKAVLSAYVQSFELGKEIYALRTDTLFWKKPNAYTKKWDQGDCPLVHWVNVNSDAVKKAYRNS